MKWLLSIFALAGAACVSAQPRGREPYHLIPGSVVPNRGPDGNSVFVDAPDGLILVDTGRHPEHRDRLLGLARARRRPVAAIVNTHWHLDHTTGNAELRAMSTAGCAPRRRSGAVIAKVARADAFKQFVARRVDDEPCRDYDESSSPSSE